MPDFADLKRQALASLVPSTPWQSDLALTAAFDTAAAAALPQPEQPVDAEIASPPISPRRAAGSPAARGSRAIAAWQDRLSACAIEATNLADVDTVLHGVATLPATARGAVLIALAERINGTIGGRELDAVGQTHTGTRILHAMDLAGDAIAPRDQRLIMWCLSGVRQRIAHQRTGPDPLLRQMAAQHEAGFHHRWEATYAALPDGWRWRCDWHLQYSLLTQPSGISPAQCVAAIDQAARQPGDLARCHLLALIAGLPILSDADVAWHDAAIGERIDGATRLLDETESLADPQHRAAILAPLASAMASGRWRHRVALQDRYQTLCDALPHEVHEPVADARHVVSTLGASGLSARTHLQDVPRPARAHRFITLLRKSGHLGFAARACVAEALLGCLDLLPAADQRDCYAALVAATNPNNRRWSDATFQPYVTRLASALPTRTSEDAGFAEARVEDASGDDPDEAVIGDLVATVQTVTNSIRQQMPTGDANTPLMTYDFQDWQSRVIDGIAEQTLTLYQHKGGGLLPDELDDTQRQAACDAMLTRVLTVLVDAHTRLPPRISPLVLAHTIDAGITDPSQRDDLLTRLHTRQRR